MLPVVVFVMGRWFGPDPSTDAMRAAVEFLALERGFEEIRKTLAIARHELADDVTTRLWGDKSLWGIEAATIIASASLEETHSFASDLTHPFRIGRGWTCGVGTPPKFESRW